MILLQFKEPMWDGDESEPSDFDLLTPADKDIYLREVVEQNSLEHGSSVARAQAQSERRSVIQVLTTAELLERPEPSWTVEGLIPHGALVLLVGRSQVGKTFLAFDWAAHISRGLSWFQRETHQMNVFYVALEGFDNTRIRAWKEHHQIDCLPGIRWITAGVNLKNRSDRDALIAAVQESDAGLMIIDTLNRSIADFDENGPMDMGVVIRFADRLRNEADAALLVVHHTPREANNPRGHSSLENGADTVLIATVMPKGSHVLKVVKQRNAPDGEIVKYRIAPHTATGGAVIAPVGPTNDLDQLTRNERRLVQSLVQTPTVMPGTNTALKTRALSDIGMRKSSFNAALKSLAAKGILDKSSDGKGAEYAWTTAGKQTIRGIPGQHGPT